MHSDLNDEERARIDNSFKNKEFPILCAVRGISRGWDYPELGLVINALPSGSAIRIGQQGGKELIIKILKSWLL